MRHVARCTLALAAVALGFSSAGAAAPAGPPTLAIGSAAPDFRLPGVDGKTHALADFREADLLVVVFTCNHCPTAQAYEGRLKQLAADYKDKKVAVVAISPNDPLAVRPDELGYSDVGDSLEDMKLRAKEQAFNFPYLYDGADQKVSRAYGPVTTPHVFIFDKARTLRYVGRIDDSDKPAAVTAPDTRNALDALLAGKEVPAEKTRPFGCSVKWAAKRDAAKAAATKPEEVSLAPIDEAGVRALAKNDSKKLRLVNVWATWCGPCVGELPEFAAMNQMYRRRDFELVTLSLNAAEEKDKALALLKEKGVGGTNFIFDATNKTKLFDALDPESSGALPHTVLIAPGGKVLYRKSGAIDPLELRRAIVGYLGRTYK